MVASRGEQVEWDDLIPKDRARAEEFDVFYKEGEAQVNRPGVDTAVLDLNEPTSEEPIGEMTIAQLAEWIEGDEPTINELLEYVGNDKDLAKKVLEAENQATGNEPRKGLVQGLTAIVGDA